jgi:hypothetical protein
VHVFPSPAAKVLGCVRISPEIESRSAAERAAIVQWDKGRASFQASQRRRLSDKHMIHSCLGSVVKEEKWKTRFFESSSRLSNGMFFTWLRTKRSELRFT